MPFFLDTEKHSLGIADGKKFLVILRPIKKNQPINSIFYIFASLCFGHIVKNTPDEICDEQQKYLVYFL